MKYPLVSMYTTIYVCISMCTCMYIHVYMYLYMCVYMCMSVYDAYLSLFGIAFEEPKFALNGKHHFDSLDALWKSCCPSKLAFA